MVINTAMALVIAAICLAVIATASTADAQAQRRTVTVKHAPIVSPGDVSETWSRSRTSSQASSMSSCCIQIRLSGRRECRRSAEGSPMQNSGRAALRVLIHTNHEAGAVGITEARPTLTHSTSCFHPQCRAPAPCEAA